MKLSLAHLLICACAFSGVSSMEGVQRDLSPEWLNDIMAQKDDVAAILDDILRGDGHHESYDRLGAFVDRHGNRFTGSDSLEASIDDMKAQMEAEGFDRVYTEDVTVPKWVRGEESARMLEPREADIYIMGLMNSVAGDVTAEVMVVSDFDEIYRRQAEVPGKIVVYNQGWEDYLSGYIYRTQGATIASSLGAVGTLIRSITDYSLYSPHTGSQSFWSNVTAIPSGCIAVEDAEMLHRMHKRGDTIRIRMQASHQSLGDVTSRNLIAEIRGSEKPEEVVMFGGHIDSWDVGVGAMDDGGGILITRQILTTVKRLGLRPRRTMRLVMWTAEEIGIIGGHAYWDAHKDDIDNMVLVMESDIGTFSPLGLHFHNMSGLTEAIMEEILDTYLEELGANNHVHGGLGKADVSDWINNGVPGASLYTANDLYFHYHHTEADRMSIEDPDELDRCACVFAVSAYVVANMEQRLPRDGDYPFTGPMPGKAAIDVAPVSMVMMMLLALSVSMLRIYS